MFLNAHSGIGRYIMVVQLLVPATRKVDAPLHQLALAAAIIAPKCGIGLPIKVRMLCRTELISVAHTLRQREGRLKAQVF